MADKIVCPLCNIAIDKRGYNSHIRACEAKEKIKQDIINEENEENMAKQTETVDPEDPTETETVDPTKTETEDSTDPKNLKIPKSVKILASMMGLIAIVFGVLMSISPKSKESNKEKKLLPPPGLRPLR